MESLEGRALPKALNGKYLERYYPSIWQGTSSFGKGEGKGLENASRFKMNRHKLMFFDVQTQSPENRGGVCLCVFCAAASDKQAKKGRGILDGQACKCCMVGHVGRV